MQKCFRVDITQILQETTTISIHAQLQREKKHIFKKLYTYSIKYLSIVFSINLQNFLQVIYQSFKWKESANKYMSYFNALMRTAVWTSGCRCIVVASYAVAIDAPADAWVTLYLTEETFVIALGYKCTLKPNQQNQRPFQGHLHKSLLDIFIFRSSSSFNNWYEN